MVKEPPRLRILSAGAIGATAGCAAIRAHRVVIEICFTVIAFRVLTPHPLHPACVRHALKDCGVAVALGVRLRFRLTFREHDAKVNFEIAVIKCVTL